MKLDSGQANALKALVESTPWGDIEGARDSFERCLRHALEATRGAFLFWEEHAEASGVDEFSIEPWQVEAMKPEWHRAYLARLLRSAALNYGLGTEYGGELGVASDTRRDALAPLLDDLIEIATHPSGQEPYLRDVDRLAESLRQLANAAEQRQRWYLSVAEEQAEALLAHIRQMAECRQVRT